VRQTPVPLSQFWLGLQMEYDLRKEKESIEYVLEEIEEYK